MASLTRRTSARNMKSEEESRPASGTPYETRGRGSAFGKVKTLATLGIFVLSGFLGYHAGNLSRIVSSDYFGGPPGTPGRLAYAVAYVKGPNSNVTGVVHFSQSSPTGPVFITGELKNLDPNAERGFHIHEYGDITDGCMSSGSHYNPFGTTHGGPKDLKRHVGDLGNIRSDAYGVAKLDFSDSVIGLLGPLSIIGRTVLVHTGTDDLGRGSNEDSLKTGNAGGRAACGIIGYAKKAQE
ncbi:Superoxide dismutase [Cu-Zn] OS=Cryptococcus gattii GN=SOD1 PE=2 SV=3 [Rhizoctonia solani AG-1 IB]|uniref:Superoxide dismutase [Cu-Zn] n=1 Tax=Thanatephorus cucumeris (strain AG1-IB / isolate 7/3/14) TaxID=1108050 RepID=A0A0B7FJ42_THACB|nr:Superoxide dismutase [Cu-Zn] OS=Cryptococcus gattii GN=SOD1 PE=2 SV=3 [Rhizoctonia solani AG-1 IB]